LSSGSGGAAGLPEAQPEATGSVHRLLLKSKTWGLAALPELSRLAAASFGMTPEEVVTYFHQLDYALGPDHERGLGPFFIFCTSRESWRRSRGWSILKDSGQQKAKAKGEGRRAKGEDSRVDITFGMVFVFAVLERPTQARRLRHQGIRVKVLADS